MSADNGTAATVTDFQLLGSLAVAQDGAELPLGGPRQRLVLAVLVLNAGRVVSAETLVDQIWAENAPANHTGPLRTHIWQLRRLLGATMVASRGGGYVLDIEPASVDSVRFEARFAEAREAAASGHVRRGLAHLDAAIAHWRGPAFGDLAPEPALQAEATRLDQLLLGAEELRFELLLACGRHPQVADEIGSFARAHPERERLWSMQMLALYRGGRQGDALRVFQEARTTLVEALGVEPGSELRDLEAAVLRQDPQLEWVPRPDPTPVERAPSAPVADAASTDQARLPRPPTSFVGRGEERAAVAAALAESRLVTLTGSGGCGKTRLAIAVAEDLLPGLADGVYFVDLAPVTDPGLVARAIAEPLGVATDSSDRAEQLEHVCRRIGTGCPLIVVDNCEHVVDTIGEALQHLLTRCPALRILATSREELRIGPEKVWRVPALTLPTDSEAARAGADAAAPFLGSEAVELFVERGGAALVGFAPSGDALGVVAQICRQLDGIPLAIELAAALVGSLPLGDLAQRLDDRLSLLTEARRHGPARHRTLRAALDWSFDLLDEPTKRLFARLGVFVGDFTLAAVEAVAGDDDEPLAAVRGLSRLVATSMVSCVSGSEGADRYRLLETIRQYADERLEESGVAEEARSRHAQYYAAFAAEAERHVHGPAASEWLRRVMSELPNLRAAIEWVFDHDDLDTGLRLAGSLRWFFARMMLLDEGSGWLDVALSRKDLRAELRLQALTAASTLAWMRGDYSRTRNLGEENVALARELDDMHQLAIALIMRGASVVYEGDVARAEECFTEAKVLCARLGDRWGTAYLLSCWAVASRRTGRFDRARAQLEESLTMFRAIDDKHGQVLPLMNLALAAQEEDRLADALGPANEAVEISTALGDRALLHASLCVLGRIELGLGHLERAGDLLLSSVRDFPGAHNQLMLAIALEGLAELAAIGGRHDAAAELFGFTQEMRSRSLISSSGIRSRELEAWLERAREALGAEQVKLELERGRTMTLDEAVVRAVTGVEAARGSALPR